MAELYSREPAIDRIIVYPGGRWSFIRQLRAERFDCAILLQNAFEAAIVARLAGIPRRIGYDRDGRGWLLTDAIPVPVPGEIPRHERFYYLELLRRARIIHRLPESDTIRLTGWEMEAGETIGLSPGAAYGNAKRWQPERFAEEVFRYLSITKNEFPRAHAMFEQPIIDRGYFMSLADQFRSPHLWAKQNGSWKLRRTVWQDG